MNSTYFKKHLIDYCNCNGFSQPIFTVATVGRRVYDVYKVNKTYLMIKMIKRFIFTDHINVQVSSIINLYFNPKAHCTGTGP